MSSPGQKDVGIALKAIKTELRSMADREYATRLQGYFKTGKGEYAEGDRFLGLRMPQLRRLVRKYRDISLDECLALLGSAFHEERMFALLLMVEQFKHADDKAQKQIYTAYLKHTHCINNWDLVDVSAGRIVGAYLWQRDKAPLYRLASSKNLWERRIAILATSYFIDQNDFHDALGIAERLLNDEEDLIHKAVGWMLREVGNRDLAAEERFLRRHYQDMPRTMLRYAIEKFAESKRKGYLQGKQ